MSAAKRITKKQLKDDKFVDAVLLYWDKLRDHQNLVLGGLVVVVVIVLAISWGARYRSAGIAESQQAFSGTLGKLSEAMYSSSEEDFKLTHDSFAELRAEYGGSDVGKWSLYYMGFCKERLSEYLVAEEIFEEYLAEDPDGEYEIPAKLGIVTCNGSVGKAKRQADFLRELAGSEKVTDAQSQRWLYQAAQIYMDNGYYDNASELLEGLAGGADTELLRLIEQDLDALEARQS